MDEDCEHEWETDRNHTPDGSYWWNETTCLLCGAEQVNEPWED